MENKEIRIVSNDDTVVRIVPNSRKVEGLGIVFNKESRDLGGFTEIILPEAIDGVLEKSDVLALLNHDQSKGVLARSTNGKGTLKFDTDKKGVRYAFDAPAFDLGDELVEGIKRGDINSSSFAFSVAKDEWDYKRKPLALRTIVEFDYIYDMSPCYRAAYADTAVALRNLESLKEEPVIEPIIVEPVIKPVIEEPIIEPIIAEPKVEPIVEPIGQNSINLKNNSMTIIELKDLRAQALEQNEKIFEAKKTENRTMTEKEEAQTAENNQKVKEYDLEIETESRKLGKGVIVGPYIKFAQPEKEPFSLLKAIRAKVEQREMPAVARELFILGKAQFRNAGINTGGDIVIPVEERADEILAAGSAGTGVEIIAEDKKAILPPLVDKLVFSSAGATYMTGLVGNVSIPSYSGTQAKWKTEIEAAENTPGVFSEVLFSPKRLTAFLDISKQFLAQDGVGAETLLLNNISNAVARRLENTILGVAAGAADRPQGMGYKITTGADTKANSIVPTYAVLVGLETGVDTANALIGNLAYITNGSGRGILKSIDKGVNNDTGDMLCSETGQVNGYPLLATNSVSAIAGDDDTGDLLVFGNWADLCIAQWGGYDITVDPYTQATKAMVRITINAYFDAKGLRGSYKTDEPEATTDPDEYAFSFASTAIKLA